MTVSGVVRKAMNRGYFLEKEVIFLSNEDCTYFGKSISYLNNILKAKVGDSKARSRFIKTTQITLTIKDTQNG